MDTISNLSRLDARTRAIGLAGIAEARATLAACRTDHLDADVDADRPEDQPTGAATAVPADHGTGVDRILPEAA